MPVVLLQCMFAENGFKYAKDAEKKAEGRIVMLREDARAWQLVEAQEDG